MYVFICDKESIKKHFYMSMRNVWMYLLIDARHFKALILVHSDAIRKLILLEYRGYSVIA